MKIQRYGWRPDLPDHRDRYSARKPTLGLPSSADLRPLCPPVFDQGQIGSCTANAIAAAMMMATSAGDADAPKSPMLSRLFIYYCERAMEGTADSDSGAMIRDGFKVIATTGACLEDTWPYDTSKLLVKPDAMSYQEAQSDQAVVYTRVDQAVDQIRATLAGGAPVVVGFTVYESFESDAVAQTGIMPMPSPSEAAVGGHAVLVVGYKDSKRVFIVRNSWGAGWGDRGYFYMPYDYLANSDLSDDFWCVSRVT